MKLDTFYTTQQIMKSFGVSRDRVSKIAKARKWRYGWIGRNKIYSIEDVQVEVQRRVRLGYYVNGTNGL